MHSVNLGTHQTSIRRHEHIVCLSAVPAGIWLAWKLAVVRAAYAAVAMAYGNVPFDLMFRVISDVQWLSGGQPLSGRLTCTTAHRISDMPMYTLLQRRVAAVDMTCSRSNTH